MKKLLDYFNSLNEECRRDFLASTEQSDGSRLTEGYLRKACSVGQKLHCGYCVAIERATGGAVTRKDLRPNDWQDIWPELSQSLNGQGRQDAGDSSLTDKKEVGEER